jgi:hypothetical protein
MVVRIHWQAAMLKKIMSITGRAMEYGQVRSAFNIPDDGGIWSGLNYPPVGHVRAGVSELRRTRLALWMAEMVKNRFRKHLVSFAELKQSAA